MSRTLVYLLAACVLAADQLTKWLVNQNMAVESSHTLIPGFFDLTYVRNTGGAFGVLPNGTRGLAFAAMAAVIVIIVYMARRKTTLPKLLGTALALPLGGALGNLIDRMRLTWVVDFLDIHAGHYHWPVFNIADSAICTGVGLLALYFWRVPDKPTEPGAAAVEDKL